MAATKAKTTKTSRVCSFCGQAIPPKAQFHTVKIKNQRPREICMKCVGPSRREGRA